jgi:hypothetical protein
MATTTPNFGWAVPTSTDLVKDGAVAIETLGDSIDASLVDLKGGTTGQVLAKASGTDMDFTWTTSSAGMTNPMTTTGDTIYSSSGSTPARLGIGSTGQVLTVSGGVPTWATAGGGAIKQVVTATYSTAASTNAGPIDTGLSATITPSSTSSKILIYVSLPKYYNSSSSTSGSIDSSFRVLRGSTIVQINWQGGGAVFPTAAGTKEFYVGVSDTYVDSPATTSATTYKVQIASGQSATTVYTNANDTGGTISMILMEI